MKKPKYTPEIRDRAVQLLIESEKDYPSNWAAITAIAPKIGCTPETLRAWHQKHLDQQNPIKVQQIAKSITTWTPILALAGHSNKLLNKLECHITWTVDS